MTNQCTGTTKKGLRCKNKVRGGLRCHLHLSQPNDHESINPPPPPKLKIKLEKPDECIVCCHGKVLWIELECGWNIVLNFGMTGEIVKKRYSHSRIKFVTNKYNFYFRDTRNFGLIRLIKNVKSIISKLGPDPLSVYEPFVLQDFVDRFEMFAKRRGRCVLASLLLDQKFVSGIGNYLRADIMYDAQLNPFQLINKMDTSQIIILYHSIIKVMTDSYLFQQELGPQTSQAIQRGEVNKEDHYLKNVIYGHSIDKFGYDVMQTPFKNRTVWWVKEIQEN